MELENALARFDGTHTAELKEAVEVARAAPEGALEAACSEAGLAVAATWVVKALLEQGAAERLDLEAVFATLPMVSEWEAQLHLLQAVQYAPFAAVDQSGAVEALLDAKKTLVRVWALDAFVRIAGERVALREQAKARVEAALVGSAASLRARARALDGICAGWTG